MPLFEIVFQGQVKDGVALEQARTRLGQLFQAGEQQLDVLFSGRRIVIKQNLDEESAEKYRQAIDRAGAVCRVEPMGVEQPRPQGAPEPQPVARTAAPADAATLPATPEAVTGNSKVIPRDGYMAAFSNVEAPDFGIAPLGDNLQDEYRDFTPLPLDLSALSLAPPGADLDELKQDEPVSIPDTSHLKLQD